MAHLSADHVKLVPQRQRRFVYIALCFCLPTAFVPTQAAPVNGTLQGITCTVQGTPVPGVELSFRSLDNAGEQSVWSDGQGAFSVEGLGAGRFRVSASKDGLTSLPNTVVELKPGRDLEVQIIMVPAASSLGIPAGTQSTEVAAATPASDREQLLMERLNRLEERLAALEARGAQAAGPTRRVRSGQTQVEAASNATPQASEVLAKSLLAAAASQAPNPPPEAMPNVPAVSAPVPSVAAAIAPPRPAAPPAPAPVASAPVVLDTPSEQVTAKKKIDPFSDWDWTWLNGNPRTKDIYWDSKFFTPEVRADINYVWDGNHPSDHTLGGSSELFRSGEVQLEQLGVGGDFHWENVRARVMTQFGTYSTATVRNDPSWAHGAWQLNDALRYVSEAYGGYHFNVLNGINVDAGIFMSYIGLFSYYNFDNWAYQPSYVSSNTPWFFQGVRVQIFPTPHLKIEPWFINGWQSYASANNRPGLGGQIKWTPYPWLNVISNNYGLGHDDLYIPARTRIHTDDSVEVKYYDHPRNDWLDKMAFSITADLGCEMGGGVSCHGNSAKGPKQSFVGVMGYNRWWFRHDTYGVTLGGGGINNPGRYLVLLPPINGETAASAAINSPYFTENPGDKFKAWDGSLTFDWMPRQYITFRIEGDRRHANVPYWSGRGGITPPAFLGASSGTPNGSPGQYACMDGTPSPVINGCGGHGGTWSPDLRKDEFFLDFDILVKF